MIFSDNLDAIVGLPPGTFEGSFDAFLALIHPDDRPRVEATVARARDEGTTYECEYAVCPPSGEQCWIAAKGQFIHNASNEPIRMTGAAWDITNHKLAEAELASRVRRQSAVAALGHLAVTGGGVESLLNSAVETVVTTLGVEYVKVLELLPDQEALLVRAGVGWQDGVTGQATVSAGQDSQAGFTLANGGAVIVTDLWTETRFTGPPLLQHRRGSGYRPTTPSESPRSVHGDG